MVTPGTRRYADQAVAARYPLPVQGAADWRAHPSGCELQIPLGDLRQGELLAPGLSLLTTLPGAYRFSVTAGGHRWVLNPVGQGTFPEVEAAPDQLKPRIDLFEVHADLPNAWLQVVLQQPAPPRHYLLVVARRPWGIDGMAVRPSAPRPRLRVPAYSQMTAAPDQRHHICSPTSLRMVLAYHGEPPAADFASRCRDPHTGMYGVWPRNLMHAPAHGCLGALELISAWDDLAEVAGPVVASVRFDRNELPGAPLERTAGHLLVIAGHDGDTVFCNDPAAPDAATVPRRYPAGAFSRAWLYGRGAAYIVVPMADLTAL